VTLPRNVISYHVHGHTYVFAWTDDALPDLPAAVVRSVVDERHPFDVVDGYQMMDLARELITCNPRR